jgi:hypothetical protein
VVRLHDCFCKLFVTEVFEKMVRAGKRAAIGASAHAHPEGSSSLSFLLAKFRQKAKLKIKILRKKWFSRFSVAKKQRKKSAYLYTRFLLSV